MLGHVQVTNQSRGGRLRALRPIFRVGLPTALALALAVLLIPARARAYAPNTWYVDNTSGTCSDTGIGSRDKPYCTIGAALAAHRDSGVTVVVRGGPYRERVSIGSSGSGNGPIVVRTDGSPVVIDGSDDFSTPALWSSYSGDVWLAASVDWQPVQAFTDGARLLAATGNPMNLQPGQCMWVSGAGLYVNAGGGSPAAHAAAVGHRTHGFLVSARSHVFISGFTIVRTEDKGIELLNSTDVVVKGNIVSQCGSGGIAAAASSNVQFHGNTVSDNNHHGIEFREGVTQSLIDDNESYGNSHVDVSWATGIYLAGSPNNRIENNRVHDNQDSGMEIQTGSNDNLVVQNASWSNGDHGYATLYATGNLYLNDDSWGNHTEGFSVEGGSTGTRLYNCISVRSPIAPQTYTMFVDTSSTTGFDADYNILWDTAGQPPVRFGKNPYANVAAFLAATGIGPHTFGADPRFVDAVHGDFHLRADSPAIDAATSSILGWDKLDADGFIRTDEPATPNTGTGPVPFADRGALEYHDAVLAVGEPSGGVSLALSAAFPNPSRNAVAFTLRLASASDVSFSVYDLLGREVWSERGQQPAGSTTLRWPLTGADGTRVPSGLYLARVRRGGEMVTTRFVVTR
jgi:parallel beta-helix repeat protein